MIKKLNYYQVVGEVLGMVFVEDDLVVVFGEDVVFGGVFWCMMKLVEIYGVEWVFNMLLSEQGIVGFGIGFVDEGMRFVVEIQFVDYVFFVFDQIVNEVVKLRF